MLETWNELLSKLKLLKHNVHPSLNFIQSIFEMEDLNKWLKFNATTDEQINRVQKFEKQVENLKEKLCVPNYQIENT